MQNALQSQNVRLVKEFYKEFKLGNKDAYLQLCDDEIEWITMEGMPNGGSHKGKHAVFEEYFPKMLSNFSEFHAMAEEFLDAGPSTVLVLGRYRFKSKRTMEESEAPFAHIYNIERGRIASFRQYTDTAMLRQAL